MKDAYSITIILNKNDPTFYWDDEENEMKLTFKSPPQDMHFHFGPGVDNFSDLTQKVNFLLSKDQA